MGNKNNNKKNLLVLTGFRCNNNCIVCSIADCENDYQDRSYNDITKDLKRGFKNGCDSVEFTGGEPTIRADIIKLVKEANDLGYKTISLSTNGRFFAYDDFCEKIINTGLNKVTFSLLGPNKETHDAITRTPGSFGQILTGIKNVQKNIIFVNTKMRDDTIHQVGYDPKRIIKNNKGKYFDTYRVNIDICRQCQYHKECGGIWKEYLNLFGDDEIRYFVKSL